VEKEIWETNGSINCYDRFFDGIKRLENRLAALVAKAVQTTGFSGTVQKNSRAHPAFSP
jgi:hypothetical protein